MRKLDETEINALCQGLPLWRLNEARDALERALVFADFKNAFAFMTEIATVADQMDHHPEWSNVYNRVTVRLTTHDVDALSGRDVILAKAIDTAALRFGGQ